MVPYSNEQNHFIKKRWRTLRKSELSVIGVFDIIVEKKKIAKMHKMGNRSPLLYLEVPEIGYKGIVVVGTKEYNSAIKGESIGKRAILVNYKEPDFFIITNEEDPKKAIWHETIQTKVLIFGLLIIILPMFIHTLFLFTTIFINLFK